MLKIRENPAWQPGGQADMVDATLVQRFNE